MLCSLTFELKSCIPTNFGFQFKQGRIERNMMTRFIKLTWPMKNFVEMYNWGVSWRKWLYCLIKRCDITSHPWTKPISPLGYLIMYSFLHSTSLVNRLHKKLVVFIIKSLLILFGHLQNWKSLSLLHKLIEVIYARNWVSPWQALNKVEWETKDMFFFYSQARVSTSFIY